LRKLSDSGKVVVAIDDSAFMLGFSPREIVLLKSLVVVTWTSPK